MLFEAEIKIGSLSNLSLNGDGGREGDVLEISPL